MGIGARTSIKAMAGVAALLTTATTGVAASTDDAARVRPEALEGSTATWCGDVEEARADPSLYRDRPVYVHKTPVRQMQRWAKTKPHYQDVWVDRSNFFWVVLGFTEGADDRQAELLAEFPDVGVVAVEVERTKKELRALQKRVSDRVFGALARSGGSNADVASGVVRLRVGDVTEELVAVLEAEFAGEPVCVEGPDPAHVIPLGPQPTTGDGWRLLGDQRNDGPPWFRTGIATDQRQLNALWKKAKMSGDAPEVDLTDDVVLWFADPHGSGCIERRLDGIVVDQTRSIVHAEIVMPGPPRPCNLDLRGAHHFFVALERERLPAAPFWLQLSADDPPGGTPKERIVIEVDLTVPGSVARNDDKHFDREKHPALPQRSGSSMRGKTPFALDVSCGISYLGEVNDIHWVSDEQDVPEAWRALVDAAGEIVVVARVRGEPDPHATATAKGTTIRYEPVRDAPQACAQTSARTSDDATPEADAASGGWLDRGRRLDGRDSHE